MTHYLVTVTPRTPVHTPPIMQSLYLLAGSQLDPAAVARLTTELLHDPVIQQATWCTLHSEALQEDPGHMLPAGGHYLEIAYRPGVTDNEAESVIEGARRLGISGLEQARTLRRYLLPAHSDPEILARTLANDLVQITLIYRHNDDSAARRSLYLWLLTPPARVTPVVQQVLLRDADDAELLRISQAGMLALDLTEMQAIQAYFTQIARNPTDGELETLAQTWSEHCSHKTFKARINYRYAARRDATSAMLDPQLYSAYHQLQQDSEIDSLLHTFLIAATRRVLEAQAAHSSSQWILSAFIDNAGIVAFTRDYEVSFKVETHNHPSALEPFGGANTGVGGVIRDVLGVSALPIANTDVLCFGPLDRAAEALPSGVLPPARICHGVVAGVRDYGNKLGIPTVNGAILFDPGYTANPLVFCGTVGIAPRGAHPRAARPGDVVVVLGGRTGRDGIHGATFSSIELTHTTASNVGSAVQIGDPITEKKLLDVLMQARDQSLYNAITDCGAGGLSSAVGEMGEQTGVTVELEHVPLKYAGLQPWEIWLSEAQERMVLAVPPQHLATFLELCASEDVEATPIGHFTNDQRLRVVHHGQMVVDLAMEFVHHGRPQRVLEAVWQYDQTAHRDASSPATPLLTMREALLRLLAHPNIASKEHIVRTYDHEVGGATVIKPLVGIANDGPGDAAVLQPLRHTYEGLALGCGINPHYGRLDPYWMALACIDEALRNVVAVGGDPSRTVILDNFCWGDPRQPDRLAGLVRAAAGCYDAAIALGTPFISGKDSLNNEYRDAQGQRMAIPPTLLISALAHVPDVRQTVTMDLKEVDNILYLVGTTRPELAGSHYALICQTTPPDPQQASPGYPSHPLPPQVDLAQARQTFVALHKAIRAGLVRACHDLSEGGLAVAAAEMAFAGGYGLNIDLGAMSIAAPWQPTNLARTSGTADETVIKLFSESPDRFLVEVRPQDAPAFETTLSGTILTRIGRVTASTELRISIATDEVFTIDLATLKMVWQQALDIGLSQESGL